MQDVGVLRHQDNGAWKDTLVNRGGDDVINLRYHIVVGTKVAPLSADAFLKVYACCEVKESVRLKPIPVAFRLGYRAVVSAALHEQAISAQGNLDQPEQECQSGQVWPERYYFAACASRRCGRREINLHTPTG